MNIIIMIYAIYIVHTMYMSKYLRLIKNQLLTYTSIFIQYP